MAMLLAENDRLRGEIKAAKDSTFKWVSGELKDEHIERMYLMLR